MSDTLFIALIVLSVAGFVFWNMRKAKPEALPPPARTEEVAVTPEANAGETGVARYLKTIPSPQPETGVARYLRTLPPPPPQTGVARYLKNLKAPAKPETGVARYLNSILAAQAAKASEVTFEKLLESIPAPTRESGVSRYLKAIESR